MILISAEAWTVHKQSGVKMQLPGEAWTAESVRNHGLTSCRRWDSILSKET